MTTIQLLLTALGDSFEEHEELYPLLDMVRNFTVNWISGKLYAREPDKIKPLGGDFLPLQEIMEASRNDALVPRIRGAIGDCYLFYSCKISEWLANPENSVRQ